MRAVTIILALLAAAGAVAHYLHDRGKRSVVEAFIKDFRFEQRRPVAAEDARLTQAYDNSYWVIGDAALQDVLGTVNFNDFNDEERRLWIENVTRLDDELTRALRLAREAVAARPGWPYHHALLGQLAYASQRREQSPRDHRLWLIPLRIAAAEMPGSDATQTFLAGSMIEQYSALDASTRALVPACVRRAFLDHRFVLRAFAPAMSLLGREAAIAALPNEPRAIRSALQILEKQNDAAAVIRLLPRWERLELAERARDMAEIERLAGEGDGRELREAVLSFFETHDVYDFDRPDTSLQWLRALSYYPADVGGHWQLDRRAGVLRYFLDGRMPQARPGTFGENPAAGLMIAAETLEGTPEVVLARAMLAAGEVRGAETLFNRSETFGAFEWTPFLVELARYRTRSGEFDRAREALFQISEAAQEECDVRLAREALARRDPDERAGTKLPARLPQPTTFTSAMWPAANRLSLCIEPSVKKLTLALSPGGEPAVVDVGWTPARTASFPVFDSQLLVSIPPRAGRHTLFLRTRAGAPPSPTLTITE